ncbi:hypothetical protein ACVBEF_10115 [Glaciimonas sp. GG7]
MSAKSYVWKDVEVRPLIGSFTSATPDSSVKGKVTISGVTKGNGANSMKIWSFKDSKYVKSTVSGDTIILEDLTPGEHKLGAYVFYNDLHETPANKEQTVHVLGGTFNTATVEGNKVRITGNIAGGATEVRIYKSTNWNDPVKSLTNITSNFDFTIDDLSPGAHTLYAYAYRGEQFLNIGNKTVTLVRPTPDTPTWISPSSGPQQPTSANPLKISGRTVVGVTNVNVQTRVSGAANWSGISYKTVSVGSDGLFSNIEVTDSKTWEKGKSYEVRFQVTRDGRSSEWSAGRQFNVPYVLGGQFVTASVQGTNVRITGNVQGDANEIRIYKSTDWNNPAKTVQNLTSNFDFTIDDLSPGTHTLNAYAYRGTQFLGLGNKTVTLVRPAPGTPSWISPAAGSWQKPSASAPLTFNGRSIEGVNKVEVRTKVSGEDNWTATESHSVPVGADQMVKDIPIAASKSWENGKIYTVEFRVERDAQQSGWASRDFKIDTTPPSIVWATGTDPMVGHASPGKPFTVKVDVSDALSRVDPATVKLRWKTGAGNWSSDELMINGTGDRYTAHIAIPAITKNGEQLTLQVKATDNVGNVLGYADNRQHTVTVSKPVVSLSKPVSNSWHNGQKINVSGVINAAAEIASVSIGQRLGATGEYGSWHYLCSNKEACRAANNTYRFDGVEYNQPLLKKDVEIVVLAKDVHGVETYSTANGQANGVGLPLRYDGKAPEITLASAKWQADGSLTVSGTVSDDASGLGTDGKGKGAIVLRWQAESDGQRTVDANGTGVGGAVSFSHTFAAGVFPTANGATFSVTASDQAGNTSAATEVAVISPIPKLTLSVKQLQTPRHAWFVNETVVYRLTLEVAADSACALNSHLSYALPDQLQRQVNTVLTLNVNPATVVATLEPTWTGGLGRKNLLAAGINLCAGQSLTVDIPLVIATNASGQTAISRIDATADGLTGPIALVQIASFTVMPEQGALRFEKKVDKDSAAPGEDLTYTIIFNNISEQHLSMREIADSVARHTRLQGMPECGEMPTGLNCKPLTPTAGALIWEFSGQLAPGEFGQVLYRVRIQ